MSNLNLIRFLKTNPSIAVIGATNDSRKYGNIIMKDLLSRGFNVIPINPRAKTVEGVQAFPDLKAAGGLVMDGLLVYVVPPSITLESLKEAKQLNLKKVWIQPGAGDERVRTFLEYEKFDYLMNACVMVEAI